MLRRLLIGTMLASGLASGLAAPSYAADGSVEVLHWWTSGGEAAALEVLKKKLESQGITWKDMPVAGGGGEQAMAALRARVTAGDPPTAVQALGFDITDWAKQGVVGDLSGVEAAYAAYQLYQAKHGKAPVIGGLTGDQRFFLAYAQAWQAKLREGLQRQLLLTDPHSPAKFRVNGIVRNVDAWYQAFDIKPGDALYLPPEKRVHIW